MSARARFPNLISNFMSKLVPETSAMDKYMILGIYSNESPFGEKMPENYRSPAASRWP